MRSTSRQSEKISLSAFAEREKEGERYRDEIECLQRKELVEAMEELKKCQEEVQAKTSQVKQYKKQHDELVTKVYLDCAELSHQRLSALTLSLVSALCYALVHA